MRHDLVRVSFGTRPAEVPGFHRPDVRAEDDKTVHEDVHDHIGGGLVSLRPRCMRTYVPMAPRPWRPAKELDGALDRGDLRYAKSLAEELRIEKGRPIPLDTASRFLPLIARESPKEYDTWALRWLARWASENKAATIERAAEIAASLADLRAEPSMLDRLLE